MKYFTPSTQNNTWHLINAKSNQVTVTTQETSKTFQKRFHLDLVSITLIFHNKIFFFN